jgi:hypothetical protein
MPFALAFAISLALAQGHKCAQKPDADESSHASMLQGERTEAYRDFSLAFPPSASV